MGRLLGDWDRCLFDSIAQEVAELAGTTAIFYQFDEDASTKDPLWNESLDTQYKKNSSGVVGIECPVVFKDPERNAVVGEEGFRLDKISQVYVARVDLDKRGLRRPRPGDIIKVWGEYYDVTETHVAEGHINDSGTYSTMQIDVVRRTKGPPERAWL